MQNNEGSVAWRGGGDYKEKKEEFGTFNLRPKAAMWARCELERCEKRNLPSPMNRLTVI